MTNVSSSEQTGNSDNLGRTAESPGGRLGWSIGVLVAAGVAWLFYNYTPVEAKLPADLAAISDLNYEPADVQERYNKVAPAVMWKNCVYKFACAGLCLGLIPTFLLPKASQTHWILAIVVGLCGGLLLGALAGQTGWSLRGYLNGGGKLPLLSDPMIVDTVAFAVVSLLLSVPVALAYCIGRADAVQQSVTILLAGGLAGLLVPIAAAIFPTMATNEFPPRGAALSGLWFGLLGVLLATLPALTGSRQAPAN